MNRENAAPPSVLPQPKNRCRSKAPLAMPALNRPVRIKRSGRPHEQNWLRPTAAECASRLRVHAAATLDEVMCQVTRASLSPSHYSFLQRPNRFELSKAALKVRDLFDRLRPAFVVPMKRIAGAVITFITLIHASHQRPESFW